MYLPQTYIDKTSETIKRTEFSANRLFWILVLLQLPLSWLMRQTPVIATAHALFILVLGIIFVIVDQRPQRVLYVSGYIVGAEVLWRMTDANVFWEYSKYAIVLLLGLAFLKWSRHLSLLPILYFLPLLPAAIYTFYDLPFSLSRQYVSFNLSGPFALTVALLFFLPTRVSSNEILKIMRSVLLPILGISFMAYYAIETADYVEFSTESSFLASAGFGPNQVSAMLGLGALLSWLLFLLSRTKSFERTVYLGLVVILISQTLLTFSRGGLLNFLIAAPFATFFIVRSDSRQAQVAIVGILILIFAAVYFIPQLNIYTGGMLHSRYSELNTTGRMAIMQADLHLWQDNLLFGVGPGMATFQREAILGVIVAAHTEYTRTLAEHGILGLISLALLLATLIYAFFKSQTHFSRGLTVAFMLWSLVEMSHAAMRIAIISFLFALPFLQFNPLDEESLSSE